MNSSRTTLIINEIGPQNGKSRAIIEPRKGQTVSMPGRRLSVEGWDEVEILRKDGSKVTYPVDHPAVSDPDRPGFFRYDVWLPKS